MPINILPSINASLNATTALLLILGYIMIKRKAVEAHKACMISATVVSTLFLGCYIYYHLHHGATHFPGKGWVRPVYFAILITHTILAVAQLPLIILTLVRAFRSQFEKHRVIARITLPLWIYVSITGVIVYWMLYRVSWI